MPELPVPDLALRRPHADDVDLLPALYDAVVVHSRRERITRTFTHRMSLWLVDLDALPAMPRWLRPFARFDAADHVGVPERSIRANIDEWLATQGVDLHGGQVLMLAQARSAGYVFNPITLYWCSQPDGTPECVVAEVHNTYGGRHCYLLRPDPADVADVAKEFYVSPFLDVDGVYQMRVSRPGPRLAIDISLRREGELLFAVSLRGTRHPASVGRVARTVLRNPCGSVRVSALIRAHGIWLWARRLPVTPRNQQAAQPSTRLGLRARVAELIFRRLVRTLPIQVDLPDGRRWGAGGDDSPVMRIARPAAFFDRLGRDANIGMGEAYQAGDWESPDLADLLTAFAARLTAVPPWLQRLRHLAQRVRASRNANTADVSRRNTSAHYDLSNDMFAAFLDETMSYSAALFSADDAADSGDAGDVLTRAQLRKIDAVLDYAGVVAGSDVIEIGTGWGALSIRAAQRGATVTSLTLSVEQQRLAQQRVLAAGVGDRVTILLQDYRQAVGRYDAVVSVEMIEAVGAEFWATYFAKLDALLRPGGRIALQSITMPDDRMRVTRRAYTWINKYIFPGGLIPSIAAIETAAARHTSLGITQRHDFGGDYARTLQHWRERFRTNWKAGDADPSFVRTWDYYLAYCEAGFRTAYIDVSLLQLSRQDAVEAAE